MNKDIREISKHLEAFIRGTSKKDQARQVIEWFTTPGILLPFKNALRELWDSSIYMEGREDKPADLTPVLHSIHHRINLYSGRPVNELAKRKWWLNSLMQAAAIAFFPLLIVSILYVSEISGFLFRQTGFTEISVPPGSRIKTQLPDGTIIWLNSGSELRYPQKFTRKNRFAYLDGEAFFVVVPNRIYPLVIKTAPVDLKVLGTSFNVSALPGEENIEVTLVSGRISIERQKIAKGTDRLCFLESGEMAVVNRSDGKATKRRTDVDKYVSWKEGKLIFRNDPFPDIIKRLERWYHADIQFELPDDFLQYTFTLTIQDETLPQVLEYLSMASPISWETIPGKIKDSGEIVVPRYVIKAKKKDMRK